MNLSRQTKGARNLFIDIEDLYDSDLKILKKGLEKKLLKT